MVKGLKCFQSKIIEILKIDEICYEIVNIHINVDVNLFKFMCA